ncbi:hypothetical protein GQ457_17G015540 [Hibiscus cannabinus]
MAINDIVTYNICCWTALGAAVHCQLDQQWVVRILHIQRSTNMVADRLASLFRGYMLASIEFPHPPLQVEDLVLQNYM